MYGYIYKITNLTNGKTYVGQKRSDRFLGPSYMGSGKLIRSAIVEYGKENFAIEMLCEVDRKEDMDIKEKYYISLQDKNNTYNIAEGGLGGNVLYNCSDEQRESFIEKMTEINRKRCQTPEFKERCSRNMKTRMLKEKDLQSQRSKANWLKPGYREKRAETFRKNYELHNNDRSFMCRGTLLVVNGEKLWFNSRKETFEYLRENFNYMPSRRTVEKIVALSAKGIEYKIFHINKYPTLHTLKLFYFDRGVTTIPDECKEVDSEISTESKRATAPN